MKVELPSGLTSLVDKICYSGGLKYADLALYTMFAIVAKVYSELSRASNFTLFEGLLLVEICDALLENEIIVLLFSGLSPEGKFEADTIKTTMKYYVKVFGNIRVRDLVYRYNSNIRQGNTVGIQ